MASAGFYWALGNVIPKRVIEAGENIAIFATAGTAIDLPPLPPALCKSEND
jgi:hypothetical protein